MIKSPEQLDELICRIQNHGDVSAWQKEEHTGSINLISIIANIPKAQIPKPNLMRVREKVLDRISLPQENEKSFAFLQYIPRYVRVTGGIIGGFLIIVSLTVGTAVAALESVPGQPIYPVKKIVENVQLQLATSEEEKTNLQIKFANNRVDELETVLEKQKAGKISQEEAQKVVANTVKNIQETTQNVAEKNKDEPKANILNKIVTLSSKQTAVIQAAQMRSEGEVKIELGKALVVAKTTTEQAIENIERAGLVVENPAIVLDIPKNENSVIAEGKLTAVSQTAVSIGTAQFLLTKDTEYVTIKPVDLKVDVIVKITGEIKDKKTYATKIELLPKPEPKPEDTVDPAALPDTSADPAEKSTGTTETK